MVTDETFSVGDLIVSKIITFLVKEVIADYLYMISYYHDEKSYHSAMYRKTDALYWISNVNIYTYYRVKDDE